MSCNRPLPAYRSAGGAVSIGRGPGKASNAEPGLSSSQAMMELPCGRCNGCLKDRSRSWQLRIMHEASLYDSNLFLTLDYDPEHVPRSCSLEYPHFQAFMKALRKEVRGVDRSPTGKRPVRFFCAGEYGGQFGRPHFHAILFNALFKDQVRLFNGTYRSSQAERLWGRGQVVIGTVTPRSAAYVAGYTLAKVHKRSTYWSGADDPYEDVVNVSTGELTKRRPEFCEMSRRPGIGAWWFMKYGRDLFPHDFAVQDARKLPVPRYYWRRFQESGDPWTVEDVEQARIAKAMALPLEERSERRREVKEELVVRNLNRREH